MSESENKKYKEKRTNKEPNCGKAIIFAWRQREEIHIVPQRDIFLERSECAGEWNEEERERAESMHPFGGVISVGDTDCVHCVRPYSTTMTIVLWLHCLDVTKSFPFDYFHLLFFVSGVMPGRDTVSTGISLNIHRIRPWMNGKLLGKSIKLCFKRDQSFAIKLYILLVSF